MQQVKEDDYDGLVKVMEFLKVVKEKQLTTDTMFDPLGNIIEMLRGYGVVIPEESLVQLQELPEKWGNTKRLSVQAIQQVFDYFPAVRQIHLFYANWNSCGIILENLTFLKLSYFV